MRNKLRVVGFEELRARSQEDVLPEIKNLSKVDSI